MLLRSIICCAIFSCFIVTPAYANDLSHLQSQADQAHNQEQLGQALTELNSYLQQSPDNFQALFLKARLLEQLGQASEAEVIYRQLIALNPVAPEPYNNLARLRVVAGDLADAQSLLEKAIRANPSYATVYDNLSQLYVAMARDSYGKALRLKTAEQRIKLAELTTLSGDVAATATIQKQPHPVRVQTSRAAIESPVQTPDKNRHDVQLSLADNTATKPTVTEKAFDDSEIITTLQGWAAAWSEQAADVYFIFYADDYHPPGQSRGTWKQERRVRLQKPSWIQIGLKDIEVRPINNNEARIDLIQVYRASNYQDKTRKELKMRQTPDGWRIVAERSVARLN